MATDQRNLPAFFNTNADFEAWCQGIAAQIVVAGWVKTTDTGQINNATVAKPGGTNTAQGYEIYRSAASDIYFKIEYGSGGVATSPAIWLTVATASDGAGNITGPGLARQQFAGNVTEASGVTLPSYCSGDGTYLAIVSNCDVAASTSIWGFFIDKVRDASAAATGEGFIRVGFGGSSTLLGVQAVIGGISQAGAGLASATFLGTTPSSLLQIGQGAATGPRNYNNNIWVMPIIIAVGQMRFLKAGVFYHQGDFGQVNALTFVASNFGGSHTYLTLPIISAFGTGSGNRQFTSNQAEMLAILWE